jgi:hypothetical protein
MQSTAFFQSVLCMNLSKKVHTHVYLVPLFVIIGVGSFHNWCRREGGKNTVPVFIASSIPKVAGFLPSNTFGVD